jgi:UDP-N-acetylmuramate--alanine ligase
VVIMTDINPGREQDTGLVHARDLVAAITRGPRFSHSSDEQVFYGGDLQNVETILRKVIRSGDVAIVMGSGTIYTITKHLLHE